MKLENVVLRTVVAHGINLPYAVLKNSDLSYADFKNATFNGANFENSNLTGTNLYGADIGDANFKNVNFERSLLENAKNLHTANFEGTGITLKQLESIYHLLTESPDDNQIYLSRNLEGINFKICSEGRDISFFVFGEYGFETKQILRNYDENIKAQGYCGFTNLPAKQIFESLRYNH